MRWEQQCRVRELACYPAIVCIRYAVYLLGGSCAGRQLLQSISTFRRMTVVTENLYRYNRLRHGHPRSTLQQQFENANSQYAMHTGECRSWRSSLKTC